MAGRPAHKPTESQRKQVEAMAAYGVPHLDIAHVMDIDRKTLEKHYRRELDTAHAKATSKVAEKLYEQCMNGNTSAMIFWMKARAGWSEKHQLEHTGKDGGPLQTESRIDVSKLTTEQLKALRDAITIDNAG